jgi:hypothetical protein
MDTGFPLPQGNVASVRAPRISPRRHHRSSTGAKSEFRASTIHAISWRLIPFLVLAYFFSYLDRVNPGFAALTMNADLKFSPIVFSRRI